MKRPQPVGDFIYGGHYSPMLERLLRSRLTLPAEAKVEASHRYYGREPRVALCVKVRPPGTGRYVWAAIPMSRSGASNRVVVRACIDQLAREVQKHLPPTS